MKKKSLIIPILLTMSVIGSANHMGQNQTSIAHESIFQTASQNEILDKDYKKKIIQDSQNNTYSLENMYSIVGPTELKDFIQKNDKNASIYTPSKENIKKGIFRANFHIHTVNSDGAFSVQELLDQAAEYALTLKNKPFYLAITDHNTLEGTKTAVDIIQKNPKKYKNIKVILGMEVFSELETVPNITKRPIEIHVLSWALNPFDKELNKIFVKKNTFDKCNYSYRTFDDAILLLKRKGFVGIAHPIRHVTNDNLASSKNDYYNYMLNKYSKLNSGNILFAEGYYQSYTTKEEKESIKYVNAELKKKNIIRTGSTDAHGHSIFKNS